MPLDFNGEPAIFVDSPHLSTQRAQHAFVVRIKVRQTELIYQAQPAIEFASSELIRGGKSRRCGGKLDGERQIAGGDFQSRRANGPPLQICLSGQSFVDAIYRRWPT